MITRQWTGLHEITTKIVFMDAFSIPSTTGPQTWGLVACRLFCFSKARVVALPKEPGTRRQNHEFSNFSLSATSFQGSLLGERGERAWERGCSVGWCWGTCYFTWRLGGLFFRPLLLSSRKLLEQKPHVNTLPRPLREAVSSFRGGGWCFVLICAQLQGV